MRNRTGCESISFRKETETMNIVRKGVKRKRKVRRKKERNRELKGKY